MADLSLTVERREIFGKGPAGRARRSGKIPGILYGDGKDPVPLTIDPKSVEEILVSATGMNTILDLELAGTGQRRPVMIHEYQRHPVRHSLVHIDFMRINMERKIHVRVHVKLEGLPEGVKNESGILEFLHRTISMECLPGDIPRELPIDVSPLHIHQGVRVRDLKLDPEKYRILDDGDTMIAVVNLPAAEKEAAAAVDAPTAAEPEVIKKGKKEEGAAEGGDKKPGDKKPAAAAKPEGKDKK